MIDLKYKLYCSLQDVVIKKIAKTYIFKSYLVNKQYNQLP